MKVKIYILDPPACVNDDFETVPNYLTHQYVQVFLQLK